MKFILNKPQSRKRALENQLDILQEHSESFCNDTVKTANSIADIK